MISSCSKCYAVAIDFNLLSHIVRTNQLERFHVPRDLATHCGTQYEHLRDPIILRKTLHKTLEELRRQRKDCIKLVMISA
jgi:hypothetical protein